jgi:hypothetical protein
VLIYIDGLSTRLHGNPEQRAKDRRLRTKAKLAGWLVCEYSAEGLSDQTMLSDYLDELGLILSAEL